MTIYNVGIKSIPYNNILNNGKICEGRLYRSIFKDMKINDKIIFKNHFNSIERNLEVIISDIIYFKTFTDMLKSVGLNNVLPNVTTIIEGQKIYNTYYSIDKENKFGVVGIIFKLI